MTTCIGATDPLDRVAPDLAFALFSGMAMFEGAVMFYGSVNIGPGSGRHRAAARLSCARLAAA